MKIAALVVTYNRLAKLKNCIEALLAQNDNNFDIFIIDNNSNDGTGDYVQELNSGKIYYYNTGENLGGAGGFNYGLKIVNSKSYDYCWIMDDDTYPDVNTFNTLKSKIEKIDFSYICTRVKWIDGTACRMNTPCQGTNELFYNQDALDLHLVNIDGCSFVSCFVNMKYVRKVGYPIKEFFIYSDDIEFTRRLGKVAPGYLAIDCFVVHDMPNNKSASLAECDPDRISRYAYGVRNRVYIYRTIDNYHFCRLLMYYFRMFFSIIRHSKDSQFKRISVLNKGFIKGLFFNPKIEV